MVAQSLHDVLTPVLKAADLELFDLEVSGGSLRITVNRSGGVDLEALSRATRAITQALEDASVPEANFALEVSSPGIERKLRTPEHFAGAVGELVRVRTQPGYEPRRLEGTVTSADGHGIVVEGPLVDGGRAGIAYSDIERARTVFDFSPAPKPGGAKSQRPHQAKEERVGRL